MKKEIYTQILSEAKLKELCYALAPLLKRQDCLLLSGELGTGKSTFARGLIQALTGDPEHTVPSPTFTLVQTYDSKFCPIWHYDLYRLSHPDEVMELDFEEGLETAISLIEWPQRLEDHTPDHALFIEFAYLDDLEIRQISFSSHDQSWQDRLSELSHNF